MGLLCWISACRGLSYRGSPGVSPRVERRLCWASCRSYGRSRVRLPDPSLVWGVLGCSNEGEGSVAPSQGRLSILTYLQGFTISKCDHQLQAPWLTSSCSVVIPAHCILRWQEGSQSLESLGLGLSSDQLFILHHKHPCTSFLQEVKMSWSRPLLVVTNAYYITSKRLLQGPEWYLSLPSSCRSCGLLLQRRPCPGQSGGSKSGTRTWTWGPLAAAKLSLLCCAASLRSHNPSPCFREAWPRPLWPSDGWLRGSSDVGEAKS